MKFIFATLLFVALVVPALAMSPIQMASDDYEWKKCIDIPVLGQSCVVIDIEPEHASASIALTISGFTVINETLSADHICLDDATLLKLIEFIPALQPYKPLIDKLIDLDKGIPAKVLSVCLDIKDLVITSSEISGCPELDANIICWESKCLWDGVEKFGCFHFDI
jgi:hypothetical protein